jgi:hypothetical protein
LGLTSGAGAASAGALGAGFTDRSSMRPALRA